MRVFDSKKRIVRSTLSTSEAALPLGGVSEMKTYTLSFRGKRSDEKSFIMHKRFLFALQANRNDIAKKNNPSNGTIS